VTPMTTPPLVLELSGIRQSFGRTQALRGLDFEARGGEILGIAGPNGAGKSTLVRILAGEESRDGGEIQVTGRAWEPGDSTDRVAVVHQEPQIWTNLTLAENLVVGRESFRFGRARLTPDERQILHELDIEGDADQPLAECSLAVRQRAEIARAIAQEARFFLFDEPNSALTDKESDQLFAYMHELARKGRIVILVTHRLSEMVAHCARVLVIRDGRVTAELGASELTVEAISVELVVGGSVGRGGQLREHRGPELEPSSGTDLGTPPTITKEAVLALRNWSHPKGRFIAVDLDLGPGEIVAVVGVEGSGARELVASTANYAPGTGHRAIAGAEDDRGISRGSVYLPGDRRAMLFGNLSVSENLVVRLGVPEIATEGGFLRRQRLRTLATKLVERFGIRSQGLDAPVGSLSGGNQQKVAIAAAIAREPALLVLEEPTRGVDAGAKGDIYRILRHFVAGGSGVLVYCTEVPEVFELADRVVVVDGGRVSRLMAVADHSDIASLAATIARSEHTAAGPDVVHAAGALSRGPRSVLLPNHDSTDKGPL